MNITLLIVSAILGLAAGIGWFLHVNLRGKPAPIGLKPGDRLPEFSVEDESGNAVSSASLAGQPAVLLFIRGTWCPFCARQVEDLTGHYRDMTDSGARLIFVTPKPLDTTRRVAELFNVEFEFWLDPELKVTDQLGLRHSSGVPGKHQDSHGKDTVWPTVLLVDKDGVLRYVEQSRHISDRPDPAVIVAELKKL